MRNSLKDRIVKSAMSDSLGNGRGNPTDAQIRLYQRWADGGVAAMIIGEAQCSPHFAEKPGNLVLRSNSEHSHFDGLPDMETTVRIYDDRDKKRVFAWNERFKN